MLENKSMSNITDNEFITDVSATVHYIFDDEIKFVYILAKDSDIKIAELYFSSEFNKLILKKKDAAIQRIKSNLDIEKLILESNNIPDDIKKESNDSSL